MHISDALLEKQDFERKTTNKYICHICDSLLLSLGIREGLFLGFLSLANSISDLYTLL